MKHRKIYLGNWSARIIILVEEHGVVSLVGDSVCDSDGEFWWLVRVCSSLCSRVRRHLSRGFAIDKLSVVQNIVCVTILNRGDCLRCQVLDCEGDSKVGHDGGVAWVSVKLGLWMFTRCITQFKYQKLQCSRPLFRIPRYR